MKSIKAIAYIGIFTGWLLAGCNSGTSATGISNVQSATKNTMSASSADPTKKGFVIQFTINASPLKVAYSPYYYSGTTDPSSCTNAPAIYQTTITPTLKLNSNSTLITDWQNYEYFNCNNAITKLVIQAINNASNSILVAAYSFTNPDIAYALINKKKEHPSINIKIIADKANLTAANTMIPVLYQNNIPVYISSAYSIMHNKFMVIDGNSVEFGSYNYTTEASAEQANNAVIVSNQQLAMAYTDRWQSILANQKTATFDLSQWQPAAASYSPPGYSTPVQSSRTTSQSVITPASLNLAGGLIENVQELAFSNNALNCPPDIATIGTCLPNDGDQPILDLINNAKKSINIAAMIISDANISTALENAAARGINVQIVVDHGYTQYQPIQDLISSKNIVVRINSNYEILHDKYMIVDSETVETGSYNYSASAYADNAENYVIFYNQPQLAQLYLADWQQLFNEGSNS